MATLGPPSDATRRPGAVASDHCLQTPACFWLNRAFWKDLRRLLGDTKESWVQARPLEPSRKCDGVGERGAQDTLPCPLFGHWSYIAFCSKAQGSQKTSSSWSSLLKKSGSDFRLRDTRKGCTAWGVCVCVRAQCLPVKQSSFPIPLCAYTHPTPSPNFLTHPHPSAAEEWSTCHHGNPASPPSMAPASSPTSEILTFSPEPTE